MMRGIARAMRGAAVLPARLARAAPAGARAASSAAAAGGASTDLLDATIGLPAEAAEYYNLAADFASRELAPHAARWDVEHHFPYEALRAAAGLGFASMFVPEADGGTNLSRVEGVAIIDALAAGCTSTVSPHLRGEGLTPLSSR
jgi:alkylation response protein AidB-like acyl-CoA dehydrogenase